MTNPASLTPPPPGVPAAAGLAGVARANASRFGGGANDLRITDALAYIGSPAAHIHGMLADDVTANSLDNVDSIAATARDAAFVHALGPGFAQASDLDAGRGPSVSNNNRGWVFDHVVFPSQFTPKVLAAVGLPYGVLTATDTVVLSACPLLACWLVKVAADIGEGIAVITDVSPLAPYWRQLGFPLGAGAAAPAPAAPATPVTAPATTSSTTSLTPAAAQQATVTEADALTAEQAHFQLVWSGPLVNGARTGGLHDAVLAVLADVKNGQSVAAQAVPTLRENIRSAFTPVMELCAEADMIETDGSLASWPKD